MLQKVTHPSDSGQSLANAVEDAPWFQPHWADMGSVPAQRPTRLTSRSLQENHLDGARFDHPSAA
jgi:hypothetical protein